MEETYTLIERATLTSRLPAANVGSTERLLTLLAGAALLGYAWRSDSKGLGAASVGLAAARRDRLLPGLRARWASNHADTKQALVGRARRSHPRIDHHQRAALKRSTASGGSSIGCRK